MKNRRGFTLVEIIIVVLFTTVVMLIGYTILGTAQRSYDTTSDRVDAQSQTRLIVDILEKELRGAKVVKLYDQAEFDSLADPYLAPGSYLYVDVIDEKTSGLFYNDDSYTTPYSLKELSMVLYAGDPNGEGNVNYLVYNISAEGAEMISGKIILENIKLDSSSLEVIGSEPYNYVYFEDY